MVALYPSFLLSSCLQAATTGQPLGQIFGPYENQTFIQHVIYGAAARGH